MSIREIDLAQFNDFARQQIAAGRGEVSLASLAEQWERHHRPCEATESLRHENPRVANARAYVHELAQQQGIVQAQTADELRFDFLDSDEELDDFLGAVKAGRKEDHFRDPLND